jgi:membrane associated rhomboid family serine protease
VGRAGSCYQHEIPQDSPVLPLYAVERPGRRASVTWALIGANIVVFLGELLYTNGLDPCLSSQLFYAYGLVPYSLTSGVQLSLQCSTGIPYIVGSTSFVYLTPLTSMFIHSGFWHIAGNMLFLFVFGGNIEAKFGRGWYLASYLACGLAGGVAMVMTSMLVGPPNIYIPEIGASGAISGVMAAYLVLYPRTRIISWIGYLIVPVRAFWFIGVWFLLQVLFQLGGVNTGVAYMAHIGGFTLGLVLAAVVRLRGRG